MKRIFTAVVTALFALSAFAVESDGTLHPTKDYAHWSIAINGGLSQFDGDAIQRTNQILSGSYVMWTVGLDVEYSFNPTWGVFLNFQYMPYQGYVKHWRYPVPGSNTNRYIAHNYFRGNMYTLSAMGSINLLNLFGQYRKSARWAWYINGGIGFTFYDAKNKPEEDNDDSRAKYLKDGRSMSFPVGTQVEYNINKYWAVGLMAYYRFHNKDNFEVESYTHGSMNDGEFYGSVSVRFKFAQDKKKAGGHVRNLSMFDYHKQRTGFGHQSEAFENLRDDLDSLKRRVKALEDTVYNDVLPRIAELEKKHATEPDEDGDGVPDFRDREPNTPKGSFVNYWGESLPKNDCCDDVKYIKDVLKEAGVGIDYDMSVYYAFDKSDLTKTAKDNIAKAAQKLKDDPDLKVELRGYCDFPGKADYNLKLSNRRVDIVKKELVSKYGIDESRISMTGKGKLENPPHTDMKNRRCDFYFYK